MSNSARDLREYAGVMVAVITVLAFAAIGFAVVSAKLVFGADVQFPENWVISMLSLANMFAGFLIGKATTQATALTDTSSVTLTTTTPTVASPVVPSTPEKIPSDPI